MRAIRPPAIATLPNPRLRDCLRISRWGQRGYLLGAKRGPLPARAFSFALAVAWWPFAPFLCVAQAGLVARPWARYYMTPERDAVLAIVAGRDGWHVGDHLAAVPGSGRGRDLRSVVLPDLLPVADTNHLAVLATAATQGLATAYIGELPGLVDVGRGWPRGRRLRREPTANNDRF